MNDWGKSVLTQYPLEIKSVRRGRGALLCDTNQGLKLLQECRCSKKRLEIENQILLYLRENGFYYVDCYVQNKNGEFLSEDYDHKKYILKDWYDGSECNVQNQSDLGLAIKNLAMVHKLLRNINFLEDIDKTFFVGNSLLEEYERHNREMKKVHSYIRSKKGKTEFEMCALDSFRKMYEQAEISYQGLKKSNYTQLYETSVEQVWICHGNYNQHCLLINNGRIATTQFQKFQIQLQLPDLYQFMRKILEKHSWNMQLGLKLLREYDKVLSITSQEREILRYMFLYPEKYWKQLNFYYNSNKSWIPQKNVEKLQKSFLQYKDREKFCNYI